MKIYRNQAGSAMIMTVFVVSLLSILVAAILEIASVDVQIMQNHVNSVESMMIANAGLNDALAELSLDSEWQEGFTNKAFNGGTYSVTAKDGVITVAGTSSKGVTTRIEVDVTIGSVGPPYSIRQDALRINP